MADVHLPRTLMPLFDGLPRHVDIEAPTVGAVIDRLDGLGIGYAIATGSSICSPVGRLCGSLFFAISRIVTPVDNYIDVVDIRLETLRRTLNA